MYHVSVAKEPEISFETNEYGYSNDPKAIEISNKIDEIETKISETWAK